MDGLTINEAAETTGWSPRMLRYIEREGLIEPPPLGVGLPPLRTRELQRLRTLRELLAGHDMTPRRRRLRRCACAASPSSATRWPRGSRPARSRPEGVAASDWLRFEQEKHQRLLAEAAEPTPQIDLHRNTDQRRRMSTTATTQDFKVADLALADFGRKEIALAEHEMPGLMAHPRGVRRRRSRSRARASPARCT